MTTRLLKGRLLPAQENRGNECGACMTPTWIGQDSQAVDVFGRRRRPAPADGLQRCQVLSALCRCEYLRGRP